MVEIINLKHAQMQNNAMQKTKRILKDNTLEDIMQTKTTT